MERDVLQKQVRVRRRDGYVAAEKRHRNMSVELCCVERHDVIGKDTGIVWSRDISEIIVITEFALVYII